MCFHESECSKYRGFINNLITWNLSKSIFSIRNSTKEQAFNFLKRNSYTNSYTNPLWHEIDNITYYFLISSIILKAVYLSFHWFNDSWTRGFELVTRGLELATHGFELITCGFELVTRGFELVTRGFELVTRGFELVTRGLELVTRRFELVTRGFELVLLNFSSCL